MKQSEIDFVLNILSINREKVVKRLEENDDKCLDIRKRQWLTDEDQEN